jgi:hypothetical protein
MAAVLMQFHALMAREGRQPTVVQTDRDPCFLGAEGGATKALPGRLTLWLWGHGIVHRLLRSGRPQRNGAVERWNGAVVRSWAGEPGGLDALQAVWNWEKAPPPAGPPTPYRARAGWQWERVWQGLAQVRVERKVDRQGRLSLWDRPVRLGQRWADRTVVVTFDADRHLAVIRDEHGALLKDVPLPWLTPDWVWADIEGAELPSELCGSSTFG